MLATADHKIQIKNLPHYLAILVEVLMYTANKASFIL